MEKFTELNYDKEEPEVLYDGEYKKNCKNWRLGS